MSTSAGPSDHLLARLDLVAGRVRRAVARRRRRDPEPDDPVRGLYVSDARVDELLADGPLTLGLDAPDQQALRRVEQEADRAEADGADLRLRQLQRRFGLDELEVTFLLTALAPDLDPRFEPLYGYLHDDVTRRRASPALALELAGLPLAAPAGRRRLAAGSRLVAGRLVVVEDPERPLLTRSLRVPDRVAGHLVGDDAPAEGLEGLVRRPEAVPVPGADRLARALEADVGLVYVRERPGASGLALATAALAAADRRSLTVALDAPAAPGDPEEVCAVAVREARMTGATLVVGPVDGPARETPAAVARLAAAAGPTVVVGGEAWDPSWSDRVPLQVETPVPMGAARERIWEAALTAAGLDTAQIPMGQFRLTPAQADRAVRAARLRGAAEDREVTPADLRAGAREQNAGRLEHLAQRVEPAADFDDLVLPRRVVAQLREIIARARHRDQVLGDWAMGGKTVRGRGITALFAGESGTGKTLSAEVVAGGLGLDLYTIDLSTVVDKYIGETEKNLERIFDEAEGVNGVLFFDEADALFGKRSEVSDARDRYANVEIAFLLQRMEYFDGIAVLATNLRANLDEAFTRRIDVLVDFPTPEEADRRRLWDLHLPSTLPRADDLELDYLAKAFEVSGGDIRNITLAAAYAAAEDGEALTMRHLVQATAREYRKLGRLCTESEFGPYLELITVPTDDAPEGDRDGHP